MDLNLIILYINGEASREEKNKVEDWINSDHKNKAEFKRILKLWKESSKAKDFNLIDVNEDWKKVKSRLRSKQ